MNNIYSRAIATIEKVRYLGVYFHNLIDIEQTYQKERTLIATFLNVILHRIEFYINIKF